MARLIDVARLAGVSTATVSYVLNGTRPITDDVSERVRRIAAELGYRPNRIAQALRTGSTRTLGLIVPDLSNPWFAEVVREITLAAQKEGYVVLVADSVGSAEQERELLATLGTHNLDGIFLIPNENEISPPKGLPMVVLDRLVEGFDVVGSDHVDGGRQQAAIVRGAGRRRVLLLSGPRVSSAEERREGFLAAAGDLDVTEHRIAFSRELPPAVRQALVSGDFDAVVCADDLIALATMDILHGARRAIPGDVLVVGYDDISWVALVTEELATIHQSPSALAAEAVRRMLARIREPARPTTVTRLPVEARIRAEPRPAVPDAG